MPLVASPDVPDSWLRILLCGDRVVLHGGLDVGTACWLPDPCEIRASLTGPAVILALRGVTFVDGGGLRRLHALERGLRDLGLDVRRGGPNRHVDHLEALLLSAGEPGRPSPADPGRGASGAR